MIPEISISEGNTIIWNEGSVEGTPTGVSYHGIDGKYPSTDNYVVFDVESGIYDFTLKPTGQQPSMK